MFVCSIEITYKKKFDNLSEINQLIQTLLNTFTELEIVDIQFSTNKIFQESGTAGNVKFNFG